ncbi:hypothetical protein CPLU01_03090 [Colletotrichum plurivorum]|uniref:Uncharacterized protein n=1 Tax=Colletotrichum plurivorum TaxID=2175906 RepID=A0A8H6NM38_9PEZI|nr:hypothetical protein CPLU01_03090 [Colletotrichum plurivorum]
MSKYYLELGLQNPKRSFVADQTPKSQHRRAERQAALTAQKKASLASILSGYPPANPESGRRHSCTSAPVLARQGSPLASPLLPPSLSDRPPQLSRTASGFNRLHQPLGILGLLSAPELEAPGVPSIRQLSAFGPVLARRHRREDAGQLATRCWPPAAVVETHLYRRVDGSFNDNGAVDNVGRNKQHTGSSRPSEPATSQSQTASAFSSRPPLHCPPFEPVRSAELHSEHTESSGLAPATSESHAREHGRLWTRTVRVDRPGPAAMANVEGRHVRLARHLVVASPRCLTAVSDSNSKRQR